MPIYLYKCNLKEVGAGAKTFKGKISFIKKKFDAVVSDRDTIEFDSKPRIDTSTGFIFHNNSNKLFKIEHLPPNDDDSKMPKDISYHKKNDDNSITAMCWLDVWDDIDCSEVEEFMQDFLDSEHRN